MGTEPGRTAWERHPADTARLVLAGTVALLAILVVRFEPDGTKAVTADLVRLFDRLPDALTRVLIGLLQLTAVVAPVAALLWLRRGRWAEVLLAAGSALTAGVVAGVFDRVLRVGVPPAIIADLDRPSWLTGAAFPSNAYLAATAAIVTTIGPTLTSTWRRALWWMVAVVATTRVLTAVEAPLNLVATVSLGVAIGSAALVVFGAPSRRPSLASITVALANGGRLVNDLAPFRGRTSHGPAYIATADGAPLFVKVVGRDERNADLLMRVVRFLRVKGVEDDRPVSPLPTVEREALNATMAERAGVSAPRLEAVGATDERGAYIAFERLDATPLAALPDEAFTDALLDDCAEQLAKLHARRIAHLWPSTEHWVVRPDGSVALMDFRWAELSATDDQMARDLAELVASLALHAGAERAVAAAAHHFDEAALERSLPFLQPLALSPGTRRDLHHHRELLGEVRAAVQARCGGVKYEMVDLRRVTVKTLISAVGLLFLGNVLLLFVANFGDIWGELKDADYSAVPLMVAFMLVSYIGGALSLMGAVNIRLPFGRTTEVMFAQSFLNRFIPANAGGMAMRIRYLQRHGVDVVVSAGSVGLTSLASGVMQVVFVLVFFTWAGQSADQGTGFSMPDVPWLLLVLVVAAVAGVALGTAFGRRLVDQLRIQVGRLWGELRHLARQPLKMLMLFGGAGFGKVMAVVMLWQSLNAFHITGISFAQLGAMYITATTVAGAVPTPGGVGAVEAALTAGLVGLEVDPASAAGIVVFFRVISYWLPILPCWGAYQHVQRNDYA